MRHFINPIADTITTVLGTCPGGNIVTDLVTRGVRTLSHARSLLARLTGRMPASLQVVDIRHMQPAVGVAGAARVLKHYRLSTLRPQPTWRPPRRGASLKRF